MEVWDVSDVLRPDFVAETEVGILELLNHGVE